MNELPTSSDSGQSKQSHQASSTQTESPAVSSQATRGSGSRRAQVPVYVALVVLAVLLGAQWWFAQREFKDLREDIAQRLKTGESMATETQVLVKSSQEIAKELQAKVNVLESKQVEAQSQQLALEQMYQELSRNSDDWALAEIEQVLSTANQQLQLAGNVQGAIIALQNAENRLSRSDKPQFAIIRRAIAKDLERLKALPTVDITGITLRLDSVIAQIDQMPLLADETPAMSVTPPKPSHRPAKNKEADAARTSTGDGSQAEWLANLEDKWNSWAGEIWNEVRQLVRIRDVDAPESLLLSPSQAFYARENLKLRLLNARLALLTRNEAAFRSDLSAAQDAIAKYFDTRARQTQAVLALLRQIQASNLSIEIPSLAESLNAVRNYKAKP